MANFGTSEKGGNRVADHAADSWPKTSQDRSAKRGGIRRSIGSRKRSIVIDDDETDDKAKEDYDEAVVQGDNKDDDDDEEEDRGEDDKV